MSESLSDRAVEVISAIRGVPTLPDSHPMSLHVRSINCAAANILSNALTQAYSLTRVAHAVVDAAEMAKGGLTVSQREALVVNMMLHGKMTKHAACKILALVLDGVHPADFYSGSGKA